MRDVSGCSLILILFRDTSLGKVLNGEVSNSIKAPFTAEYMAVFALLRPLIAVLRNVVWAVVEELRQNEL